MGFKVPSILVVWVVHLEFAAENVKEQMDAISDILEALLEWFLFRMM